MNPAQYVWLIAFLPALSFLVNILFGHQLNRYGKRTGAYMSVAVMAVATLLATGALIQTQRAAPTWDKAALKDVIHFEEETLFPLEAQLRSATLQGAMQNRLDEIKAELHHAEDELHHLEELAQIRHPAENFPFKSEQPWLSMKGQEGIPIGVYIDPFAAMMLFMVSLVCLLIHLFSVEYMTGEDRYPTFFAYISLFSSAMLAMVMSRNLFHVLFFWEVMGVMSYLLIGFFYKKISAQQAMKKAFLVTKLADIGLLVGLFWIYKVFGTLDIPRLTELAPQVLIATPGIATAIGLLLFIAAIGKSAQFPLHVWLLDAMEGPTPVSAMIHAATMVAAGVYLMARAYPILEQGNSLGFIAAIGAITALFAALLAPAFTDIKKILAWSTVSQLGFMFIGLGAFGWIAAVFHLVTHAFFKALLFLCSGSMIHGSGTQDIFKMDNLAKYMPSTRWTFIIGGLSLAGVVPFAGFWSKDEILLSLKHAASDNAGYGVLLLMAYAASFLTALYITRAYIIAFEKPSEASPWDEAAWNQADFAELNMTKADLEADAKHDHLHLHDPPHESGWHITASLWTLAGGSVIIGLLGSPLFGNAFQSFIYKGSAPHIETIAAQIPGFIIGTAIAFAGITTAYILYMTNMVNITMPKQITQLLHKRFYIDELYYKFMVNPLTKLTTPTAWVDRRLLDGAIDFIAWGAGFTGNILKRVQTGRLDLYAWTIAAAALALLLGFAGFSLAGMGGGH